MIEIEVEKDPVRIFHMFYLGIGVETRNIAFWTIGDGVNIPKWIWMLNLLDSVYKIDGKSTMDEFDWQLHVLRKCSSDYTEIGQDGVIEPRTVTNELIFGTPLMSYLTNLQRVIIELGDKIEAGFGKKKSIMADTLLRKPRIRVVN